MNALELINALSEQIVHLQEENERLVDENARLRKALEGHHDVGNQLTVEDWGKSCRICAALEGRDEVRSDPEPSPILCEYGQG